MSDRRDLLELVDARGPRGDYILPWEVVRGVLDLPGNELARVQRRTREMKQARFGSKIKLYYPGRAFPSISVTGTQCALHCLHCDRKYLRHMVPAETPDRLWEVCRELDARGAVGCLISGGDDASGAVPLDPYLDVIRRVKQETRLVVNVHTGLVHPSTARGLARAGVDVVSLDVTLDPRVIKEVYHLSATPRDYQAALELLLDQGVPVVPHVTIGLYQGRLGKELAALQYLARFAWELVVFIVLIPPKNPPGRDFFVLPDPVDVSRVLTLARLQFPRAELSLGCMRPKTSAVRDALERQAIQAGINRLVIPSKRTIQWLESSGAVLEYYDACCALPGALEDRVRRGETPGA